MCQRQRPLLSGDEGNDILADVTMPSKSKWWRPLHPLFVLAMIPLCPSWFFLNRGFTQWFHWGCIFFMLTGQQDFWRRFVVVNGGSVCAGWYAAVVHDYLYYSRFCHLLYNNMPQNMRTLMLTNTKLASGGINTDTASLACIALTHMIDILAHPLITYAIWKMHTSRGGTLRSLVTWDIIVATYAFSRLYSMVHLWHNEGAVTSLFYYGYDVYNIDNLESYTVGYAGEALFSLVLACYKLYNSRDELRVKIDFVRPRRQRSSRKMLSPRRLAKLALVEDPQTPNLIKSVSSMSTQSLPVPCQ